MRASPILCALLVTAAFAACRRPDIPPEPELAEAAESPAKPVFLFLGDSLTAGYGVAMDEAYPALLAERWDRDGLRYEVRNAGVSGSTSAGVLENLDWHLQDGVHTVFVAIGANDGLRGLDLDETERNIGRIVAGARERGARVVLAGMKIPPNYGPEYAARFEDMYRRLAKRHGVPLLPFLLDGVGGVAAMNVEDGIHPNAAGHRLIAKTVHEFLDREGLLR